MLHGFKIYDQRWCKTDLNADSQILSQFSLRDIISRSNPIPAKYRLESSLAINDDDDPGVSEPGAYIDADGDVDYLVLEDMI